MTKQIIAISLASILLCSCGAALPDSSITEATSMTGEKGDTGATGPQGPAGPAGTPGITIANQYGYHVDSYAGKPNIGTESVGYGAYIGDIYVTIFSDRSSHVFVSGQYIKQDTNGDSAWMPFSYSFYLRAMTADANINFKFDSYVNARIGFIINTAAAPTFKASVDLDGTFNNNTYETYSLAQNY